MAEVSGNPIVNRSDSVAASYLKSQDLPFNPVSGNIALFPVNLGSITPTSGGTWSAISGGTNTATLNVAAAFTTSGRSITAAGSGIYAPLGYFAVQVSGNTVVVPFFAA